MSTRAGVAAVYWKGLPSIEAWAKDSEHQVAMIRIRKVERAYGRPDG